MQKKTKCRVPASQNASELSSGDVIDFDEFCHTQRVCSELTKTTGKHPKSSQKLAFANGEFTQPKKGKEVYD